MIRSTAGVVALLMGGEEIAQIFALPVPGAVLGLLALTCFFALRGGPDPGSEAVFNVALPYFPLLFVPVAVGVMDCGAMIDRDWVYILVAIIGATTVTLLATGLIFQTLLSRAPINTATVAPPINPSGLDNAET